MMRARLLWLALAAGGLMAAQPAPQQGGPEELSAEDIEAAVQEDPPVPQAIVRGKLVQPGEALWQIAIYTTIPLSDDALEADRLLADDNPRKQFYDTKASWERDHVCGGVLIGDGWALSAAHCFVDSRDKMKPLASRRARMGDYYLPEAADMAIERVILHGDYKRAGDKRHDIALIKLVADEATDRAKAFSARPVRWMMEDARALADGDRLEVTGWGVTGEREAGAGNRDVEGRALRASASLKYADLLLVPMARCAAIPSYSKTIGAADKPFAGVLCVAGDETRQDSCQGDSGGPLTRGGLIKGQLVGLVSTGSGCGLEGVPALYTKVSAYEDWIAAAMKYSKPGAATRCVLKRWFFGKRLVCED